MHGTTYPVRRHSKAKPVYQVTNTITTQDDYVQSMDGSTFTDGFTLSLDGSNTNDKDGTIDTAPCRSFPELLSDTTLPPSNNTFL